MGNFEMARTLFAISPRQFRRRAEPWVVGDALGGLAWVALTNGDRADLNGDPAAARPQGPNFALEMSLTFASGAARSGRLRR